MSGPRILALWSAPRCRSTAFLRMMVERGDRTVLHEPFSHLVDFGYTDVAGVAVGSEAELIAAIRALSARMPVFFKDTTDFAYPGLLADEAFLRDAVHTFIVRHPAPAIASHFALNPRLTRDEVGFERLCAIHDAVAAATGRRPAVIDADDLVAYPESTVRAYCGAVGLPYLPNAVRWAPGMLPQWRTTARWHASTSGGTGFTAPESRYPHTVDNHPVLAEYLAHHLPFFQKLHARRLAPVTA